MYATFSGFPGGAYLLSIGGVLLLVIIIGSVFIERFFCKYLCPLGALFSAASKFRIFRINKLSAGCGNCKICAGKCKMSIPMNKYNSITSGECINCMSCTTVCHRDNVKADAVPALSGTTAAVALMGVYYVGCIPANTQENTTEQNSSSEVSLSEQRYIQRRHLYRHRHRLPRQHKRNRYGVGRQNNGYNRQFISGRRQILQQRFKRGDLIYHLFAKHRR